MIVQVARQENAWTADAFLDGWGSAVSPVFRTKPFQEFADATSLPVGTYLFSDIEIATRLQLDLLAQVWGQLKDHGASRLLNHPLKTMARYDLLKALHSEGINEFRVFRLDEIPDDLRFPVFVRIATDHQGSRTPLIANWHHLEGWLLRAMLGGTDPDDLLITEFCETRGSDGLYRKYSVYLVGDELFAKHIHFSRNWMLKNPDLATAETLEEERTYMEDIPDKAELRRIFDLAHVQYGRVDYAYRCGKIQVWEINTNPVLLLPEVRPEHVPAQRYFAANLLNALMAIDSESTLEHVPIRLKMGYSITNAPLSQL